jgi:hypothetical protein
MGLRIKVNWEWDLDPPFQTPPPFRRLIIVSESLLVIFWISHICYGIKLFCLELSTLCSLSI